MPIDFKSCREEIAGALQEFCNRCCTRGEQKVRGKVLLNPIAFIDFNENS